MSNVFLTEFLYEAQEYIEEIDRVLHDIEDGENSQSEDAIANIFRLLHTLKGSSKSVDLLDFGSDVHCIENLYSEIMSGTLNLDADIVSLQFKCNDYLTDCIYSLINGEAIDRGVFDLLESQIKSLLPEEKNEKQAPKQDTGLFLFEDEEDGKAQLTQEPATKLEELSLDSSASVQAVHSLKTKQEQNQSLRARILIVDDDEEILEMMSDHLEDDYEVKTLANPMQAIDILKRDVYDLLILDYQMPEMTGIELAEQVEKLKYYLPMIMVSGLADRGHIIEFLRHGMFDFLEKPYDIDQLSESVERGVNHGQIHKAIKKLSGFSFRQVMHTDMLLSQPELEIDQKLRANLEDDAKNISSFVFELSKAINAKYETV